MGHPRPHPRPPCALSIPDNAPWWYLPSIWSVWMVPHSPRPRTTHQGRGPGPLDKTARALHNASRVLWATSNEDARESARPAPLPGATPRWPRLPLSSPDEAAPVVAFFLLA